MRFPLVLALAVGAGNVARADAADERFGIGVGLASPSAGLSLNGRFDERHSGGLVLGDLKGPGRLSVQAQVNRGRSAARGGYWLLGVGDDDPITIVRAGWGYRLSPFDRLQVDLEVALNVPVRADDDLGLAGIGYLFPFAASVRYLFGAPPPPVP